MATNKKRKSRQTSHPHATGFFRVDPLPQLFTARARETVSRYSRDIEDEHLLADALGLLEPA